MRYWCLVTSRENWEICKKNSIWGMDYRYLPTLEKFVRKGDKTVVYTHGGNFVATVDIVSDGFEEFTHIGWAKKGAPYMFPYRVRIKVIKEGAVHITTSVIEDKERAVHHNPNPIDDIVFISDKGKTWNIYLQVSIINISEEDFNTITSALEETSFVKPKALDFQEKKESTKSNGFPKGREGGRQARKILCSRLEQEGIKIKHSDDKFYFLENGKKLHIRFSSDLGNKWWFGIAEREYNNIDYILVLICIYNNSPLYINIPQEKVKNILINASKDQKNDRKINISYDGNLFLCRELEGKSLDEYVDNFGLIKNLDN